MATLKALPDLISLRGKRALITGSAAGIGKAIAYRFAEAGADLELVDIDNERLATTKKELARQKSVFTRQTYRSRKREMGYGRS
jgi:NAD(P)-dependent dehydrogenase (short-subunit alcohol dehydrogenase family)